MLYQSILYVLALLSSLGIGYPLQYSNELSQISSYRKSKHSYRHQCHQIRCSTTPSIPQPSHDSPPIVSAIKAAIKIGAISLGAKIASATTQDTGPFIPADAISLDSNLPPITDICWFDIKVGTKEAKRVEISLFGTIVPKTVENFKNLCSAPYPMGYAGSDVFRIISNYSIQAGNIGAQENTLGSQLSKYGRSSSGTPLDPENYRILHSYNSSGVVSMMKDITKNSRQDSRFFVTLYPSAEWADGKYVAFGIVSKGMECIQELAKEDVVVPMNYPRKPIKITASGVYNQDMSEKDDESLSTALRTFLQLQEKYQV
jgi:peptidyl-prolyl cis-trans isomerase B (cyclophilin B)